jgi:DNA mismatch repair protein MutL
VARRGFKPTPCLSRTFPYPAIEPLAAWILDQHDAHERALLDRLTYPDDEQMPTIQSLLAPEVVELPPQDGAEAAELLEDLSVYGFEVEPFGKGSFRINGVISTLAQRGDAAGAFREAFSAMKGTAPGMSREEPRHHSVSLGGKAGRQAL